MFVASRTTNRARVPVIAVPDGAMANSAARGRTAPVPTTESVAIAIWARAVAACANAGAWANCAEARSNAAGSISARAVCAWLGLAPSQADRAGVISSAAMMAAWPIARSPIFAAAAIRGVHAARRPSVAAGTSARTDHAAGRRMSDAQPIPTVAAAPAAMVFAATRSFLASGIFVVKAVRLEDSLAARRSVAGRMSIASMVGACACRCAPHAIPTIISAAEMAIRCATPSARSAWNSRSAARDWGRPATARTTESLTAIAAI